MSGYNFTIKSNNLFNCSCFSHKPYSQIQHSSIDTLSKENSTIYIYENSLAKDKEFSVDIIDKNKKKKKIKFIYTDNDFTNLFHDMLGLVRLKDMVLQTGRICFCIYYKDDKITLIQAYPIYIKKNLKTKNSILNSFRQNNFHKEVVGTLLHMVRDIVPEEATMDNMVSQDDTFPVQYIYDDEKIYIDKRRLIFTSDKLEYEFAVALINTIYKRRSLIIIEDDKILYKNFLDDKHKCIAENIDCDNALEFFGKERFNEFKLNLEYGYNAIIQCKDKTTELKIKYIKIDYNESQTQWALLIKNNTTSQDKFYLQF